MTCEINGVLVEVKVGEHRVHGGGFGVEARHGLPCGWVIVTVILGEHQEVLEPSLFKHAHQIYKV